MKLHFRDVNRNVLDRKMQNLCFYCSEKRDFTMLSDTLTEGLDQYEIGPKIRALRLKKGLGLVQLGEHSGL